MHSLIFSSYGKQFLSFVDGAIYCVGAGMTTLMSISEGLGPYNFCREMEKTRFIKEKLNGQVNISRQIRHFSFIDIIIKALFLICTLNWRVNNHVCRQGKGINSEKESLKLITLYNFLAFGNVFIFLKMLTVCFD